MAETSTVIEQAPRPRRADMIQTGARGLELSTMAEMLEFSAAVAASGLAPKGMETREKCFVAVVMGAELGMTAMMSIQNIAPINGRPGVFGDAMLGLVRDSGLLEAFDEWFEVGGKRVDRLPTPLPAEMVAVCYSKRRGAGERTTTFSAADARLAGLWGKAGPWLQYPTRMLMFRARGFNLRDNFGDVLKGFKSVEELQDTPAETTVTVAEPPTGRQKLRKANEAAAEAPAAESGGQVDEHLREAAQQVGSGTAVPDDVTEGEVLDPPAAAPAVEPQDPNCKCGQPSRRVTRQGVPFFVCHSTPKACNFAHPIPQPGTPQPAAQTPADLHQAVTEKREAATASADPAGEALFDKDGPAEVTQKIAQETGELEPEPSDKRPRLVALFAAARNKGLSLLVSDRPRRLAATNTALKNLSIELEVTSWSHVPDGVLIQLASMVEAGDFAW